MDDATREPRATVWEDRASDTGPLTKASHGRAALRTEADYSARLDSVESFEARYEDRGPLGRGGMGEVRLCLDRRTGREVAIKRIDPALFEAHHRDRFLREARVQARLDHPTLVPVYEIGVDAEGRDYFAMKPVAGRTLEAILRALREGHESAQPFSLPVRLRIFRQVCQAVSHAHARGIIHRDIKPSNVIVGELGQTYLLDWGIAKLESETAAQPPTEGLPLPDDDILGTPGYMSPEQLLEPETVDARADVYALGALLFELLTLEPLHSQTTRVDELLAEARLRHERLRDSAQDVAPELSRVCEAATEPSPELRLASVSALLGPVGSYLDGARDLALRRTAAQRHAESARAALQRLLSEGDPLDHMRATALREAGHALALDPNCEDAVEVFTRLLGMPPETVPREAAEVLEQQESMGSREMAQAYAWVYATLLPLFAWALATVEVYDWLAIASMVVPIGIATAAAAYNARARAGQSEPMLKVYATLIAIAATASLGSPYVIMPGLMGGFVAVSTSYVKEAASQPLRWGLLCAAAALVPIGLQALGRLPVDLRFDPGGYAIIHHQVTDASPTVIYATLVGSLLVGILAPMAAAYRATRVVRQMRRRLLLQMWQLRQLTSRSS